MSVPVPTFEGTPACGDTTTIVQKLNGVGPLVPWYVSLKTHPSITIGSDSPIKARLLAPYDGAQGSIYDWASGMWQTFYDYAQVPSIVYAGDVVYLPPIQGHSWTIEAKQVSGGQESATVSCTITVGDFDRAALAIDISQVRYRSS